MIEPIQTPEVTRMRLAYMAVAMRDPNPVHVDDAFAAQTGLPSVIAHGTFAVSYLGAVVSRHVGVAALRRLRVELTAPVFPGDSLLAAVEVNEETVDKDGVAIASGTLTATKPDGTVAARGMAEWVAV
ncbi:MAG: MaoC family dehydratase [Solirubrobacterales bacterium]